MERPVVVQRPSVFGTCCLLISLVLTGVLLTGDTATAVARFAAWGVGIGLLACVAVDIRQDWHQLFRADLMALFSLYFLTLFEFVFDQPRFDELLDTEMARAAILACLVGFAGIAVGRHLVRGRNIQLARLLSQSVPQRELIRAFWLVFAAGYFYMLYTCSFNPLTMVEAMMSCRFDQPWTRGKFGDWTALLYELSMLIYLIPPLAGVVIARRHTYPTHQVAWVAFGLLFTLFYGFSGGTRNLFLTYLATGMAGYVFAMPPWRKKESLVVLVVGLACLFISTTVMLDFRTLGLKNYLLGERADSHTESKEFFVDHNLYVIGTLTKAFPERHHYLGFEIPYLALIRPIPRALWPGKPEGMSASMEDYVGVEGLTLSSTFIGEAHMSGGLGAVLAAGLFFGALARWWGNLARPENSDFGILVYASGLFSIVISMRSLLVLTTAMLPTLAAVAMCWWFSKRGGIHKRARTASAHEPEN